MKSVSIQFFIKIDEGIFVVNGINETFFENISENNEEGFFVEKDETNVSLIFDEFIDNNYPDYEFIEPTFQIFLVINGKMIDEVLNEDEFDLNTIQEYLDNKEYLIAFRDKRFNSLFE